MPAVRIAALGALALLAAAPSRAAACSIFAFIDVVAPAPGELLPTDGVPIVFGAGDPARYEVRDADGVALAGVTFARIAGGDWGTYFEVHRAGGWPAGATLTVVSGETLPGSSESFEVGDFTAAPGGPGPIEEPFALGISAARGGFTSCGRNVHHCLPGLPDGLYRVDFRAGPDPGSNLLADTLVLEGTFYRTSFPVLGSDLHVAGCAHVRRRDVAGREGPTQVVCSTEERTCVVDDHDALPTCAHVCDPPPLPPLPDAGPPTPADGGPMEASDGGPSPRPAETVRYGCGCTVASGPLPAPLLPAIVPLLALVGARRRGKARARGAAAVGRVVGRA